MSRWGNLATVFNTLREVDVNALRDESERDFTIACFGQAASLDTLTRLLYADVSVNGTMPERTRIRYGPAGNTPLSRHTLPHAAPVASVSSANVLLLALDGRRGLDNDIRRILVEFANATQPCLIVVLHAADLPDSDSPELLPLASQIAAIPDPDNTVAPELLAAGLLAVLPEALHVSAARKLPGLRPAVARDMVGSTSFSNGTYSAMSGVAEIFPVLNLTVAAADMLILTKNQVMLVYKLALAHGAPPDFQQNLREAVTVVGMGYIWRQAARTLVGLIPVFGIVPKVAVSYAGTYTVGVAAWRWFAHGEIVSTEKVQQISEDALGKARMLMDAMLQQARQQQQQAGQRLRRLRSGRSQE